MPITPVSAVCGSPKKSPSRYAARPAVERRVEDVVPVRAAARSQYGALSASVKATMPTTPACRERLRRERAGTAPPSAAPARKAVRMHQVRGATSARSPLARRGRPRRSGRRAPTAAARSTTCPYDHADPPHPVEERVEEPEAAAERRGEQARPRGKPNSRPKRRRPAGRQHHQQTKLLNATRAPARAMQRERPELPSLAAGVEDRAFGLTGEQLDVVDPALP